ncbi:MAG: serine/threonine protein kinase [Candidatus Brocadiae bacterium]|nr:serine/threonine protein kinase [Candidatus Brocadiia bacterium]
MNNAIQYQRFLGQYLGKFRIEEFACEETSGIVFSGRQEALERKVAIKLLWSHYDIQFILKNFQKILSLEHEQIATVYDAALAEILRQNYVVEQWIEGKSLKEILEGKKGLPLEEAIQLMLQIVRPVAAAHEKEVVHGNICLENIIQAANQKLFMKGFGLNLIYNEGESQTKGDYAYMAPELFTSASPDFSSDIYSLGCIFFMLLTGELPYGSEADASGEIRRYIPNVRIPSAKERFVTTRRYTASFAMKQDDSQSKKKSYPIGLLRFSSSLPDPVVTFLLSTLALDPQDRFADAKQCLLELEKLAIQCRFLTCPRCGKKNIASEVFTCNGCNTEGLCLSHLVPEKQSCNRCVEGTKRQTKRILERPEDWNKLIQSLREIANNAKMGVLVLGRKPNEVALDILSEGIEFYAGANVPKLNPDKLEDPDWEIVCHSLVHFLKTGDSFFEFWENDPIEKILPGYNRIASLELSPGGYLISFSQVIRISRDLSCGGGLYFDSPQQKLALIFSLAGVLVGTFYKDGESNFRPIPDQNDVLDLLPKLLSPSSTNIQYRTWSDINTKDMPVFPFSPNHFLDALKQAKGWIRIGQMLPESHSLLPPCQDWEKPFAGTEINQISSIVAKNLFQYWDVKTASSLTGFPILLSHFLFAAIAKERVSEVSKILVDSVGKYGDKIPPKSIEGILLQAHYLTPDSIEICSKLSQFYHSTQDSQKASLFMAKAGSMYEKMGDIGLALPAYERSVALYPQNRSIRLKLLEIYEKLDNREKLKESGLEFFNQMRQSYEGDEKTMEKICKSLLSVDSSLAICHEELIKIYNKKKDKENIIQRYEALIQIYEKAEDKEAMAKAMISLLQWDNKRLDMKKKLQKLGYKDWKRMPKNLAWMKKTVPVALASLVVCCILVFIALREQEAWKNISLVQIDLNNREKYQSIRPVLMNYATGCYLTNVAEKSMDLLIQIENNKKASLKKQNEMQESRIWKAMDSILDFYEKRQNWKEAYELCEIAKDQFSNETFASKLADSTSNFQQKLKQKEEEINQQAQRLYQRGLKLEEQKEYAQAVDIYYRILNNPNFQFTNTVKEITLPLVIETTPSNLRCYNDEEFLGTSPLVYRYSPSQFPFVRAIAKGLKEYQRQTIRTNSNYIWKIHIVLK